MRTLLKMECIGDGKGLGNAWVAEITGIMRNGELRRVFLKKNKDYSQANSVGTRGVYAFFVLDSGRLYEVMQPLSWSKTDHYFCSVDDIGQQTRFSMEEVLNHFIRLTPPLPSPAEAKEELEKLWLNSR